MSTVPNPAEVAGRFKPRTLSITQRPRAAHVLPTGWSDDIPVPPRDRHFYLDTGIFHSIAGVDADTRLAIMSSVQGNEHNVTIRNEVFTQKREPLYSLRLDVAKLVQDVGRRACSLSTERSKVETIRGELIADAQIRHPDLVQTSSRRDVHGGEAELIHLAELHTPTGAIVCNDAGASAVGLKHGVTSIHFLHILRASLRAGAIVLERALSGAKDGLAVSGLAAAERSRTCCASWLQDRSGQ